MKRIKLFKKRIKILLVGAVLLCVGWLGGNYHQTITRMYTRFFHKPTVSVLMSTYNRAQALPYAIESILNQTYTDFEFIIVDDGSTDNTMEQLRFYAQKDPRLVIIQNNGNHGLIYSLNRGLDRARGKYVARMDDDDKALPWRLERQVWAMERYPEITVLGGGIIWEETPVTPPAGVPSINNPDEVEINTYFSSGLAHPTIMIRRDFLEKNKIRYDIQYTYAEDCGLYKDVLEKGGKVSSLKEVVLHFGYVTGVTKPKKYAYIQSETFKKIQKEKLAPFFDAPQEWLGAFTGNEIRCNILKKMVPANKENKILNQEALEQRMQTVCRPFEVVSDPIKIKHPFWQDSIVLDKGGKKFYRQSVPEETGEIVKEDKTTVILSWDKWDEEVYQKTTKDEWQYMNDVNGNIKQAR